MRPIGQSRAVLGSDSEESVTTAVGSFSGSGTEARRSACRVSALLSMEVTRATALDLLADELEARLAAGLDLAHPVLWHAGDDEGAGAIDKLHGHVAGADALAVAGAHLPDHTRERGRRCRRFGVPAPVP